MKGGSEPHGLIQRVIGGCIAPQRIVLHRALTLTRPHEVHLDVDGAGRRDRTEAIDRPLPMDWRGRPWAAADPLALLEAGALVWGGHRLVREDDLLRGRGIGQGDHGVAVRWGHGDTRLQAGAIQRTRGEGLNLCPIGQDKMTQGETGRRIRGRPRQPWSRGWRYCSPPSRHHPDSPTSSRRGQRWGGGGEPGQPGTLALQ